jgi:hypothetical protein
MRIDGIFLAGVMAFCCLSCSTLSLRDIAELVRELPRHSSSQYITRRSLPRTYFDQAYAALDDPHVYIVLSDTGSPASKLIRIFTAAIYNHVSLSFDRALETLVSYNGGNGVSGPGLNAECLSFLNRKTGASLVVYRLRLEPVQKSALINRVARINQEGSSYNLLGLVTKKSKLPNIMFCSQFVYSLLDEAGLAYFEKEEGKVQPEDFITAEGPLELLGRIALGESDSLKPDFYAAPPSSQGRFFREPVFQDPAFFRLIFSSKH